MSLNLFIPLRKIDVEKRLVYGTATAEEPDRAGEVCRYDWSKPNFEAWSDDVKKASNGLSLGNIRGQHGDVAAGRVVDITFDDAAKQIDICTEIVDDNEWSKVCKGVYTGFSIGGAYGRRVKKDNHLHYEALPNHIAIVDRPCLEKATFTMIKSDGSTEEHEFVAPDGEEVTETVETVEASPVTDESLDKAAVANPRLAGKLLKAIRDSGDVPLEPSAEASADTPAVDPPADAPVLDEVAKAAEAPDTTPAEDLTKAEDDKAKEPYGDVAYADSGLQEDGKKRYPIDTASHIRAAWNYINKAKNAKKYSGDQVSKIKAKIVSAWKDKIDKEGPPSAVEKTLAAVETLKKHFMGYEGSEADDIREALWVLESVCALKRIEEGEGEDESEQVRLLAEACACIAKFVALEAAELAMDHSDGMASDAEPKMAEKALMPRFLQAVAGRIAKAAAPSPVTATLTPEQIEEMKKSLAPATADASAFKLDDAEVLMTEIGQGIDKGTSRVESALSKAMTEVERKLDVVAERVKEIAKGPAIEAPIRSAAIVGTAANPMGDAAADARVLGKLLGSFSGASITREALEQARGTALMKIGQQGA